MILISIKTAASTLTKWVGVALLFILASGASLLAADDAPTKQLIQSPAEFSTAQSDAVDQTGIWNRLKTAKNRRNRIFLGLCSLAVFGGLLLSESDRRHELRWVKVVVVGALVAIAIAAIRMRKAPLIPWFSEWGLWVLMAAVSGWLVSSLIASRKAMFLDVTALSWWKNGALICLAFSCAVCWFNFGSFHHDGRRIIHAWDMFHYYVGSKYVDELGYENLYRAVIAADYVVHGNHDIEGRKVRDLSDNQLFIVTESKAALYAKECGELLGDQRFAAFRSDVQHFRTLMGDRQWKFITDDHGYNATPLSVLLSRWPSNIDWQVPRDQYRFEQQMIRYAAIDWLLYVFSFGLIGWAFGLRACTLAMVIWAIGQPWEYAWTGGSYARVGWFFGLTAAVCFLKKGLPFLAGFALAFSSLMRLFPMACFGGGVLKIVQRFFQSDRNHQAVLTRDQKRFFCGGVLGFVVLGAFTLIFVDWSLHTEFAKNTAKHNATPLNNHVGLPTLLSWEPSQVGRLLRDDGLVDPWSKWKEARKATLTHRRWLHVILMLAMAAMIALASRYLDDWAVIVVGSLLIVGLFQLTCYYYTFVVLWAPLAILRRRYCVALIAMGILTNVVTFVAPVPDETYLLETGILLVTMLYLVSDIILVGSSVENGDERRQPNAEGQLQPSIME